MSLRLVSASRSFLLKEDSPTNPKGVPNAEKQGSRSEEKNSTTPSVQNVQCRPKCLSNPSRVKIYFVGIVLKANEKKYNEKRAEFPRKFRPLNRIYCYFKSNSLASVDVEIEQAFS